MNAVATMKSKLFAMYDDVCGERPMDLTLLLTIIMLMFYAGMSKWISAPVMSLGVLALLGRTIRQSRWLWLLLLCVVTTSNAFHWYEIDNHKYLINYWIFAVFLSRIPTDPAEQHRVLIINGQVLLALCMVFAVVSKLMAPDYLSGTYFTSALLLDSRFSTVAVYLGGVAQDALDHNRAVAQLIADGQLAPLGGRVPIATSAKIDALAQFMTWWAILVEAVIAVLLLVPYNKYVSWVRNALILLFGFTTYTVPKVIGFGWILLVLGIAQTREHEKLIRLFYVLVFSFIQIYNLPTDQIAAGLTKLTS